MSAKNTNIIFIIFIISTISTISILSIIYILKKIIKFIKHYFHHEDVLLDMLDKSNKFIPYNFNKNNKEYILTQIKNRDDRLKSGYTPEQLIEGIRNSYTQIEIEYLLTNYEIQSKKYTDQNIQSFVTLFIAIGAFAISCLKDEKIISSIIFCVIAFIILYFILLRAFSPNGSKLNTAIFWLKQAKELDEPQKNEQTDKDDDE